jgi:hypothetical protein
MSIMTNPGGGSGPDEHVESNSNRYKGLVQWNAKRVERFENRGQEMDYVERRTYMFLSHSES